MDPGIQNPNLPKYIIGLPLSKLFGPGLAQCPVAGVKVKLKLTFVFTLLGYYPFLFPPFAAMTAQIKATFITFPAQEIPKKIFFPFPVPPLVGLSPIVSLSPNILKSLEKEGNSQKSS